MLSKLKSYKGKKTFVLKSTESLSAVKQASRYKTYTDFQGSAVPVSNLANSKQGNKRQRMRVLKTLNDKMLVTFNLVQKK